jgi:hypothetical protein
MNRRAALITLLMLPLGYYKAFAAEPGWLTVDLGQWGGIKVRLGGKEHIVTAAELFAALGDK